MATSLRTRADSSHRQLQNHRNKTVRRDRPQSTPRIQLLNSEGLLQELEDLNGCGDLAGETSNSEGLVSERDGDD